MKIVIYDNNKYSCDGLLKILKNKYDKKYDVSAFSNTDDFLKSIRNYNEKFDVLISNLDNKNTTGIDLAYIAQRQFPNIKIIFSSDDTNIVEDIYIKVRPYAYINKPVNLDILDFHLKKIEEDIDETEAQYFVINNRNIIAKIPYKDILYFESQKRKLIIHTINNSYSIYKKINDIEKYAPNYFIRCHQSYLVNPYYTKGSISSNSFELATGQKIPISRSRLSNTQKTYFEIQRNQFV